MSVTLLGIRHHGPGSSRHVRSYLTKLKPDLILLEAPAEAQDFVQYVGTPELKPPVALLAYQNDDTSISSFYPFATFSPEWQAMLYANNQQVPLWCFDLPLAHTLEIYSINQKFWDKKSEQVAKDEAEVSEPTKAQVTKNTEASSSENIEDTLPYSAEDLAENPYLDWNDCEQHQDPFDLLAQAADVSDGEVFWENVIELRYASDDVFEGVNQLVGALRESVEIEQGYSSKRDLVREAWMRKKVREAEKAGFKNIVVVCGAWHVPAVAKYKQVKVKDDNALLKGLPKTKVSLTWIPWTYSRLSFASGYGAGIFSPKWYEFLFNNPKDDGTKWLTTVAKVLRKAKYDISVAHVMEAVRLVHALCAMRNLSHPTLAEYKEAIISVMGFGNDIVLKTVSDKLIVGKEIGAVPTNLPKVPLLADFERLQKKLRLPFTEEQKTIVLDLRKPLDLERSTFFHRLDLIKFKWAKNKYIAGLGSFKEQWVLEYKPECILSLIDKAVYGSTLEAAICGYVSSEIISKEPNLDKLARLLSDLVSCDLPKLLTELTNRIDDLCVTNPDPIVFIRMIKSLVPIVRYGDVRNLDYSRFKVMISTLLERILATGLSAVINIDEAAALQIMPYLDDANLSIKTLNSKPDYDLWFKFISLIQSTSKVHPLLSGTATRLLFNLEPNLERDVIVRAISFYTSVANQPTDMAFWLQGFLYKAGNTLCIDDDLWLIVHSFICSLSEEDFICILPILRRTFSTFEDDELQELGSKAQKYDESKAKAKSTNEQKSIISTLVNAQDSSLEKLEQDDYAQSLFNIFATAFGLKTLASEQASGAESKDTALDAVSEETPKKTRKRKTKATSEQPESKEA